MRCKACNRMTENFELCTTCETASMDLYFERDAEDVLVFDPTPDNIESLLKTIKD